MKHEVRNQPNLSSLAESPYPLLDGVADPLGLAMQALAKLKAHNLATVADLDRATGLIDVEPKPGVVKSTRTRQKKTPNSKKPPRADNVVDLDDYRLSQQEKTQTDDKPSIFDDVLDMSEGAEATMFDIADEEEFEDNYRPERKRQVEITYTAPPVKRLTAAQQHEYVMRAKGGDKTAVEKLCRDLEPFIRRLVFLRNGVLDSDDYVQEGMMQIMSCIERYDAASETMFSTFLSNRVKGAMLDLERRGMTTNGVSRHTHQKITAALKSENPRQALHELVTDDKWGSNAFMAGLVSNDTSRINFAPASLETPHYTNDASGDTVTLADTLADASLDIVDEIRNDEQLEWIEEHLEKIPTREAKVLMQYYGLLGNAPRTYREIGEGFGVTESRISQLHKKAIERLHRYATQSGILQPVERDEIGTIPHKKQGKETQRAYQTRLLTKLEKHKTSKLTDSEIAQIMPHLPNWSLQKKTIGEITYSILSCPLENDEVTLEMARALHKEDAESDGRAVIGSQDNELSLISERLTGADFMFAVRFTQINKDQKGIPYNYEFSELFRARELEIIKRMHEPHGVIAHELGVETSTVRTQIHTALKKLGLNNREELAVVAAREGVLSLDDIPAGETDKLNKRQLKILVECWNLTYEEAAAQLGIAVSTFRTHRHDIYRKLGVIDNLQATMRAVKDGLITDEFDYPEKTK